LAGRAVNRDAAVLQPLVRVLGVLDLKGEVADTAGGAVVFRVPIIGAFDCPGFVGAGAGQIAKGCETDQGQAAECIADAADLLRAQQIPDVGDMNDRAQDRHRELFVQLRRQGVAKLPLVNGRPAQTTAAIISALWISSGTGGAVRCAPAASNHGMESRIKGPVIRANCINDLRAISH
jgi:hypothetical protein